MAVAFFIFLFFAVIGIIELNGNNRANKISVKTYEKATIIKKQVEQQEVALNKAVDNQKEDKDFIINKINYNIKIQHKMIRDDDAAGWAEWNYYNCQK